MFNLDSLYDLAKDRHTELLKVAGEARRARAPELAGRSGAWRRLALSLAAMTLAAAVFAVRVAAAAGGGGGGSGPHAMF